MCVVLERGHLARGLAQARRQFRKREYEAATRTALVAVEEEARRITGIDGYGAELFARAFAYKSNADGSIVEPPRVHVNDLKTDEQRNEHEGMKILCMGVMRGVRNIVAHHNATLSPLTCLSVILLANMVIDVTRNGSMLNKRTCLWTKVTDAGPPRSGQD